MGRRLQWLLLPVALAEEGTQCFDGGIKVDPESLSAFAWQELAQGHNYYRCLHDVTSYTTMLTALYFGTADPPVSVLVKDAAALGAVWLNPKVQDHFLLYTHGAEVMSVHAIGTNLTADHFPHADHCGPLPCSVVEVAEADADCASASGCQAEVARWMGVLAEKQAVEQDVEPAFCTMATLASQEDSPRSALMWLEGYADAQCLLTKCSGGDNTMLDYEALYACKLQGNVLGATSLCLLLLFFYFILMGVVADSYLVPALISIGRGLQMSDALLGATLLALGGSANDFMTGFVSALTHNGDAGATENDIKLWLGGVFGTGVFINTFVASLVLLFAGPEGIKVDPVVLTRDIGFRFLAVGLMMLFGVLGFVSTYMALFMNFLYVVYVLISLRESRAQRIEAPTAEPGSSFLLASFASRGSRVSACSGALAGHLSEPSAEQSETCRSRLKRHAGWEDEQSCLERLSFVLSLPLRPFFALTMATDTWDPVVNVLLPFGMCIFIPFGNPFGNVYSDASEALSSKELGSGWTLCATLGIFWLLGLALSFAAFAVARRRPGVYLAKTSFNWATFLTSLLWVALFANEVVGAMQLLGTIMGLKPMVMGITLLAWGNCVDNVFAMLGLAKAR
ncbi:unnamed protein product, partial [Effrenium voratum]